MLDQRNFSTEASLDSLNENNFGDPELVTSKAVDDIRCMGLMASPREPKFGPPRSKSSWAATVDERMNNRFIRGGNFPSSMANTCGSLREVEGVGLSSLSWIQSIATRK
ncbi:hypothetical protein V6N13_061924 [Hibiscus sabdariffa]|uniref:Uncharacterized protein n=2 Tax=Hibiscus sabdariffa TaxID=183260 RepID=A0ABR2BQY3_9ROSI